VTAVICRAMPCNAVQCRALPCIAVSWCALSSVAVHRCAVLAVTLRFVRAVTGVSDFAVVGVPYPAFPKGR
jgi:hypothetical protein